MPQMPRPNAKCQKILERIIGKPENQQNGRHVYRTKKENEINPGLNKELDRWYNHPFG